MPPGADFARALAAGLRARHGTGEGLGRVTVYLNSLRMLRAVTDAFLGCGDGLLPRLRVVTAAADDPALALPPAAPRLRRVLELSRLTDRLLAADPGLAPRSAAWDLAETLAALLDEMEGEGVPPDWLARIDAGDHAAHWQRTQAFLALVAPLYAGAAEGPDSRLRRAADRLAALWARRPPDGPVYVAGSTASRGATAALMRAVAALPQGVLVLPGFDFDMPPAAWAALDDALTGEDHPQYRFVRLLAQLGAGPADVRPWEAAPAPDPDRNRVLSLALRPAPVTDRWLAEGPALPPLPAAMARVALVEAPSPRAEALAIALALRDAAAAGRHAALLTPDRHLARQVAAALDRWRIVPDDAGGEPLDATAPGRFLRLVAGLAAGRPTAAGLLALLKHPLAAAGGDRGPHLMHTRALEARLRRHGPPFPTPEAIRAFAARVPEAADWADWLAGCLSTAADTAADGPRPLAEAVAAHRALAERLAAGPGGTPAPLWTGAAGAAALAAVETLAREAAHGGDVTPAGFADLLRAVLNAEAVREPVTADPRIRILGTLEARIGGADLVILGGLNEGAWPAAPGADPWLNRAMRAAAGLLLPERRIGLAAHDFQQAAAAPEAILTRALRDADSDTTPSRWLNRLTNLLEGLPDRGGPDALRAMRARGQAILDRAAALDRPPAPAPRAARPAPCPPVAVRPRQLSVTQVTTLVRDPYAVYARHVLRLRPLDPLLAEPDARLRGSTLHAVLEAFVRGRAGPEPHEAARRRLMDTAAAILAAEVPWPAARALWLARLDRAADALLAFEAAHGGEPLLLEEPGACALPALGFTLTARPDRIDRLPDGRLHVIDYKTGSPPSPDQQRHFDKQLPLEAAMAVRGAFRVIGPAEVGRTSYVGLGSGRIDTAEPAAADLDAVWSELEALIARYARRSQGYAARRAVDRTDRAGDYDHLARLGEWTHSDMPVPVPVGGGDDAGEP